MVNAPLFFRQYELMQRKARTEAIEQTRLQLEQAEERLFFFDKYDKYEMEKVEKVATLIASN